MGEPLVSLKLLLVEGNDEIHAVEAVRDALGVGGIDIRSFGGKDNLPGMLKALTRRVMRTTPSKALEVAFKQQVCLCRPLT